MSCPRLGRLASDMGLDCDRNSDSRFDILGVLAVHSASVDAPILDRFRHVGRKHPRRVGQIRNRTRHLQDAMVPACRQSQPVAAVRELTSFSTLCRDSTDHPDSSTIAATPALQPEHPGHRKIGRHGQFEVGSNRRESAMTCRLSKSPIAVIQSGPLPGSGRSAAPSALEFKGG